jgi:cyclin D1/2/4, plant
MAPSYECSASILLCAEDNNTILGFEEDDEEAEATSLQDLDGNRIKSRVFCANTSAFRGDFLDDFPLQSDECLTLLVKREVDHLPLEGYYERLINCSTELSIRATAIDWIWKVGLAFSSSPLFSLFLMISHFSCN